jgi:hypothetical protein
MNELFSPLSQSSRLFFWRVSVVDDIISSATEVIKRDDGFSLFFREQKKRVIKVAASRLSRRFRY